MRFYDDKRFSDFHVWDHHRVHGVLCCCHLADSFQDPVHGVRGQFPPAAFPPDVFVRPDHFISVAGWLLSLLGDNTNSLYASILLVLGFAINGYVITPKINQARDEFLEGNAEKDRLFKILHTVSVVIFLAQFGLSLFMIGLLSGVI